LSEAGLFSAVWPSKPELLEGIKPNPALHRMGVYAAGELDR
jgi:hypothetical protein